MLRRLLLINWEATLVAIVVEKGGKVR